MASQNGAQAGSGKVVEVAIAIIRRASPGGLELLICQRKADAVLGGYWEFPGGKIHPNEPPAIAAERESKEELDVAVRAIDTLVTIVHSYDYATVRLTPVICDYLSGDPKPLGCSAFRWIALADLSLYRFPPANTQLLQDLADRLK